MSDTGTAPELPEQAPEFMRSLLGATALAAAGANVIMELAQLPVGHGVALSKVDSGRADLRPIKRGRTTLSYIMIAMFGTDHERAVMREEINGQHRQVRSEPGAPVGYNAFDRDLQLWVAACLYVGMDDVAEMMYGPLLPGAKDRLYRECSRLATTLQVPADMWPADRAAFEEYWNEGLKKVEFDETTRTYLYDQIASFGILPAPLGRLLGPLHRLITAGFLRPPFRDGVGLAWNRRRAFAFRALMGTVARTSRFLPGPAREFPWNLCLWDARRRIRRGTPFV